MGDIDTHAEISKFLIAQARGVVPDAVIAEADYSFLELGNFLTDVSQFRDPASFHRAREEARSEAGFLARFVGSGDWVGEVFGEKTGPVHGALPQMLARFMAGATHMIFDDDALPRVGAVLNAITQRGPSVLLAHGIPADQVDAALTSHYTQYFPHEHLDWYPLPPGQLATHRQRPEFAIGPRALVNYLETYLRYLTEELSALESAWLQEHQKPGGLTQVRRRQLLLQLGHLLHAVEDYFFHSNLPELQAWAAAAAGQPVVDRGNHLGATLAQTKLKTTVVAYRRLLNRRLRYPTFVDGDQLSPKTSEDATGFVYTGGFGQTDVWHTLGGALEALEEPIKKFLPDAYDPRRTDLVMFRMLLDSSARAQMVDDNSLEKQRDLHLQQLRNGVYHRKINELGAAGTLCPHAQASFLAAFDLDLDVSTRHAKKAPFPGPGALFITMLDKMQRERAKSAEVTEALNLKPESIDLLASTNQASAENIGTHSLMSKDAIDKEPLRPEAVALAKHASASIGVRFLERVAAPAPADVGIDWEGLLRFYVRGVVTNSWESEILTALKSAQFRQPDIASLHAQPVVNMLGPSAGQAELAARRRTPAPATAALEAHYRSLES